MSDGLLAIQSRSHMAALLHNADILFALLTDPAAALKSSSSARTSSEEHAQAVDTAATGLQGIGKVRPTHQALMPRMS